ncbi:hypothetical protein MKW98_030615, partial [Papaver atlanticum]
TFPSPWNSTVSKILTTWYWPYSSCCWSTFRRPNYRKQRRHRFLGAHISNDSALARYHPQQGIPTLQRCQDF